MAGGYEQTHHAFAAGGRHFFTKAIQTDFTFDFDCPGPKATQPIALFFINTVESKLQDGSSDDEPLLGISEKRVFGAS
jgi:hypothetical protein